MNPINLNKIPITGLEINEEVNFDKEYYQNTDILELKHIKISGEIKRNIEQDIILSLEVKGTMILPDSRTLDPNTHDFSINIEEVCDESNENIREYYENKKNILDIMGILWENIVLEVPICKTANSFETKEGNGWELIDEKKESIDPRLAPLEKLLDKEKE